MQGKTIEDIETAATEMINERSAVCVGGATVLIESTGEEWATEIPVLVFDLEKIDTQSDE